MNGNEFNKKQLKKCTELIYNQETKTQKEKDIWNLKYVRYTINFGSSYHKIGLIKTLDRVIKMLEDKQ